MNLKFLAVAAVAGAFLVAPVAARAACCDQQEHAHLQAIPEAPARQSAEVWFTRPVFAGKAMLLGHYVIEHDYDRMARGEPCTHIYAYDNRTKPVSSFHCTHLDRNPSKTNKVVLATMPDGKTQRLTEFQFAGDPAGHGYPRR